LKHDLGFERRENRLPKRNWLPFRNGFIDVLLFLYESGGYDKPPTLLLSLEIKIIFHANKIREAFIFFSGVVKVF
jgi:hypothetical protein